MRARTINSLVVAAALAAGLVATAGEKWEPIPAAELALKDDPLRPGAAAVVLYREVFTDHVKSSETHHVRIKVLTPEGKKYADIEIPFWKGRLDLKDLEARVIQPDGRAVPFTGNVYEKTVARARGVKLLAKTFTLPDVGVGSILELKYRLEWGEYELLAPDWEIQGELSLRRGRFTVRPYAGPFVGPASSLQWGYRLPPGKSLVPQGTDHVLEVENIPAFEREEFTLPEGMLKVRVRFYYAPMDALHPELFWNKAGKRRYEETEKFLKKRKPVRQELARLVRSGDDAKTKLRKLYARAQQLAQQSYKRRQWERARGTEDKLKANKNVEEFLKRGYGSGLEVNRYLVALARAAGFEADVVWLSTRSEEIFNRKMLIEGQLNAHVVWAKAGAQEYYLDPATRWCPFGLLPWDHTGVEGIRPTKNGAIFIQTPEPVSTKSVVERRATLRLNEDGSVEGRVVVGYEGHRAIGWRFEAEDEDEEARRRMLEQDLKNWLPDTASVQLEEAGPWEESGAPLRAVFEVKLPEFAAAIGQRLLLPIGIFQTEGRQAFGHGRRAHGVYFRTPWQELDDITIELPKGYRVEGLPAARTTPTNFGRYEIRSESDGERLRVRRRFVMDRIFFSLNNYPQLQEFYNRVRAGDELQAVLQSTSLAERPR